MANTESKICTKCGEEKPLKDFRPKRNQCRECERALHRKWVKDVQTPENKAEHDRLYRLRHPNSLKSRKAEYRERNQKAINMKHAVWREATK